MWGESTPVCTWGERAGGAGAVGSKSRGHRKAACVASATVSRPSRGMSAPEEDKIQSTRTAGAQGLSRRGLQRAGHVSPPREPGSQGGAEVDENQDGREAGAAGPSQWGARPRPGCQQCRAGAPLLPQGTLLQTRGPEGRSPRSRSHTATLRTQHRPRLQPCQDHSPTGVERPRHSLQLIRTTPEPLLTNRHSGQQRCCCPP